MARVVEVRESRVEVERRGDGLHVQVPRRRPWSRVLFVTWFAVVWTFALVSMVAGEPPENGAAAAFLGLWGVFGVVGLSLGLWGLLHRETLRLDAKHLTHTRALGPIQRARAFERARVEDLRLSVEQISWADPRANLRMYGVGGGTIAFDYGDRTVRLADAEEAEAKRVIAALAAEGLAARPSGGAG